MIPNIETVRVFNKTGRTVVWMDDGLESPPLEPLEWTDRVPAELASKFGQNGDFSVDWQLNTQRRVMKPQPLYTKDGTQHLLLASPMDPNTGYGYLSLKIAEEIGFRNKTHLSMHALAYWHKQRTPEHIRDLMARDQEVCKWSLAVTIPPELPNVPSPHIVLYSMWETRELPAGHEDSFGWANLCNSWAEAVILPCEEQREIFKRAGVRVPTYVVPVGVDDSVYYPRDVPKSDKFTIWTHGRLTSRKSPLELLTEVVWPVLGKRDDWELKLKTWGGALGAGEFLPIINDERVQVINKEMTGPEMAVEMSRAHVGAYLSKFEGWGMPFREALACGMVTLASRTSGHVVDCDPHYNFPIALNGTTSAGDGYSGTWDMPDWEMARKTLQELYALWKEGRWNEVVVGQRGSDWIRARRRWGDTGDQLLEIVNEVYEEAER